MYIVVYKLDRLILLLLIQSVHLISSSCNQVVEPEPWFMLVLMYYQFICHIKQCTHYAGYNKHVLWQKMINQMKHLYSNIQLVTSALTRCALLIWLHRLNSFPCIALFSCDSRMVKKQRSLQAIQLGAGCVYLGLGKEKRGVSLCFYSQVCNEGTSSTKIVQTIDPSIQIMPEAFTLNESNSIQVSIVRYKWNKEKTPRQ